jgi:hypothetical protein
MGTWQCQNQGQFPFQRSIEQSSDDSFSHYGEELSDFIDAAAQIGFARINISMISRGLWRLRRQTNAGKFWFLTCEK